MTVRQIEAFFDSGDEPTDSAVKDLCADWRAMRECVLVTAEKLAEEPLAMPLAASALRKLVDELRLKP